jgi:hypothetical protein
MSIGYNKTKYPNMTQTSYYRPRDHEKVEVVRPVSQKLITRHIERQQTPQPDPLPAKREPDMNNSLIRQEPAGMVFYKEKSQKIEKPRKVKKNRIAYYSSEDEEMGTTKKIYANVNFKNFFRFLFSLIISIILKLINHKEKGLII